MSDPNARAVLNHLIETCKDGERGFRHAAELVSDPGLKALLIDFAGWRARLADELLPHAQRLGGSAASGGTAAAAMHRRWMDVRSNLSGHDDRTILAEARRGDTVTLAAYKKALEGALPISVRDVVERHFAEVRDTHDDLDRSLTEAR